MAAVITPLRVLVTASRDWANRPVMRDALIGTVRRLRTPDGPPLVLVHGAARGGDTLADDLWERMRRFWGPDRLLEAERWPAKQFPSPRARNQHMVDLGAEVCVAFALGWASGTGMCARMARLAGIDTRDFGVSTRVEDRPVQEAA